MSRKLQPYNESRAAYLHIAACFTIATAITAWFIAVAPMYISPRQMALSGTIAGGKWMIQIGAGYLLLREKRLEFLKRISFTCFVGSVLLLPYAISGSVLKAAPPAAFIASLAIAVAVMIILYYRSVRACRISLTWWFAWLACLAIAITLQLTVVFNVI